MPSSFVVLEPGRPVGEALREARTEAGLSQMEVAQRSGVARPNLSAIESGTRSPSPEMTGRILDAIRGRNALPPALRLGPSALLNIEMARAALFRVIKDPASARNLMSERLALLRTRDDGTAARWLDFWDGVLTRWDLSEVVTLLLSTGPDDLDRRKVSPIAALLSAGEAQSALERARLVWRAAL